MCGVSVKRVRPQGCPKGRSPLVKPVIRGCLQSNNHHSSISNWHPKSLARVAKGAITPLRTLGKVDASTDKGYRMRPSAERLAKF